MKIINDLTMQRPVGRPALNEADVERRRAQIAEAADFLYGHTNLAELSVESICAQAEISRPTFYKCFANKEEVIELTVRGANAVLIDNVINAVGLSLQRFPVGTYSQEQARIAAEDALRSALGAYVHWGLSAGPVVPGIYRDSRIPGCAAKAARDETFGILTDLLQAQVNSFGAHVHRSVLEGICVGIEHIGTQCFLNAGGNDAQEAQVIEHMMQLCAPLFAPAALASNAESLTPAQG